MFSWLKKMFSKYNYFHYENGELQHVYSNKPNDNLMNVKDVPVGAWKRASDVLYYNTLTHYVFIYDDGHLMVVSMDSKEYRTNNQAEEVKKVYKVLNKILPLEDNE